MPTGLTHDVQSGKVAELHEYAMICARQFGALIMMRDAAHDAEIPEAFEPSEYHAGKKREAEQEVERLRSLTDDAIQAEYQSARRAAEVRRQEYIEKRAADRVRYEAMLGKVRDWAPPTPDHQGLRDMMEKQLVESIKFDCDGDYLPSVPSVGWRDWHIQRVTKAENDVTYHAEQDREERERVESRNAWLKALRESLAAPGPRP